MQPGSENDEARSRGYITFHLAPGEKLVTCPYMQSHRVLEARFARHLIKCRANYLKDMAKLGKSPEYKICRYNYKHHFLQIEMANHESMCPDAASVVDHLQKFQDTLTFGNELKARSKAEEEKEGKMREFRFVMNNKQESKKVVVKLDSEIMDSDDTDDEDEVKKPKQEVADDVCKEDEECWEAEVAENLKKGNVTYNPEIKLNKNRGKIIQSLGGMSTKAERREFRKQQYEAFESRGGDFFDEQPERNRWSAPVAGPSREPERMTESEIRVKRARELATAQKNASLIVGHLDPQNRKRRSDQALEQINNIISLAQSERQSQASDATSGTYYSTFSS